MFDVVCIGNATLDVFIEIEAEKTEGCIILPCGSKQEVKGIHYATGGGATNTAVSFSRMGLNTAILAAVGKDDSGHSLVHELRKEGVNTDLITKLPRFKTAYSAIVTGRGFDRIIFTYGGATTHLESEGQIKWHLLKKTKWFYVSSFHSKPSLMKKIFAFAEKNRMKVAWNPGKSELKHGLEKLKPMLKKTDILFLNEEEAEFLTGESAVNESIEKLQKQVPLVVITRGKNGSISFDGKKHYVEGTHKVEVVDSTGAGDAFNAGFLTATLWGKEIQKALVLGTRNAEAILVKMGAKNNLLKEKQAKTYT